LISLQ